MLDLSYFEKLVNGAKWTFALTQPFLPHEYCVFPKADIATWRAFAQFIYDNSRPEMFGKAERRYLTIGEYKYWSMEYPPFPTIILINRTFADKTKYSRAKTFFCTFPPKRGAQLTDSEGPK